ncbi:molybdopterin-dependent oxidoreductase [Ammoniphilus resinae]|uniref:DMSO/TMAO reductase YedYZ molybdopterin-dependent catalytic subunit n=1 Tax=Ammoniphilus resinae TaxID=861532 RepID=A0ABS4GNU9_9BACL|nr:molybdopterin-dependent oxidoreductase [Ammoniphilus resinae]MBP1931939.1 DMSO/TMAO reductase YedYZ molybdopterin-dependent catalytic subunit [Ammoniphilus resinae]
MEWRKWLTKGFGKKLKLLHAWNAWTILLLAVTGIVLYIPSLRGTIAFARVVLKEVHIVLGIGSILLLLLYLPMMGKHLNQLAGKKAQHMNLWLVLFFIVGWTISGLVLWLERQLPKGWSQTALFWHDLLTWVGIPYVLFHTITRSRWISKEKMRFEKEKDPLEDNSNNPSILSSLKKPLVSRRTVMQWVTGLILVFALGPTFHRWLKRALDGGGSTIQEVMKTDGNHMFPHPIPQANSNPPIGGGAQGNFRVYTVTPPPSFTSNDWKFEIGGLVAKPQHWSWEQFSSLPRKVQVSDFHCVTGWSVYKVTWEGIPLSELLEMAKEGPSAKYVKFYSGDKVYTDSLSLEQSRMEDVMVAVLMDGKPIPQKLGGPVRLIIPKMYAYKSVKWLQAIELIEEEHIGYWEVRGYDTNAWVNEKRLS